MLKKASLHEKENNDKNSLFEKERHHEGLLCRTKQDLELCKGGAGLNDYSIKYRKDIPCQMDKI